jgi:predicted dehydrogenase
MKPLRVGVIGYGMIGKIHTMAYLAIPVYSQGEVPIKLAAICSGHEKNCKAAMQAAPFEWTTTDYHQILASQDLDVVSICSPNYLHREMVTEALQSGKHVYAEKPLALNLNEAEQIMAVFEKNRFTTGMAFVYRFIPAVMRARQMIDEGALGRVFHFRMAYHRSKHIDEGLPITWRFQKQFSGGGALADLGSHLIDLTFYLLEDQIQAVFNTTEIFVARRRSAENPANLIPVDVDDYSLLQVRMVNGAVGVLEASRYATGSENEIVFEIFGSRGALKFNINDPGHLYFFDVADTVQPLGGVSGFKAIQAMQRYPDCQLVDPYTESGWIRYHIASQYYFLKSILEGEEHHPNLEDGLQVQRVLEAAYLSAEKRQWVNL